MKQNKVKKIEGIARIWPHSVLFVLFFFFSTFFSFDLPVSKQFYEVRDVDRYF